MFCLILVFRKRLAFFVTDLWIDRSPFTTHVIGFEKIVASASYIYKLLFNETL